MIFFVGVNPDKSFTIKDFIGPLGAFALKMLKRVISVENPCLSSKYFVILRTNSKCI